MVGQDLNQKLKGAFRIKVCLLGFFSEGREGAPYSRRFCEMVRGSQPLLELLTTMQAVYLHDTTIHTVFLIDLHFIRNILYEVQGWPSLTERCHVGSWHGPRSATRKYGIVQEQNFL